MIVLGHVEVPVNVAPGGTITRRRRIPVYGEDPRHYPPLVALALNPSMVDYLIQELDNPRHSKDGFVRELEALRDEMKEALWTRVVD